jgi:hypothetical protein
MHDGREPRWSLNFGRLEVAGRLRLSVQRGLLSDFSPQASAPPRSYGLAPIVTVHSAHHPGTFAACLHDGEVAWIGIVTQRAAEQIRLRATIYRRSPGFRLPTVVHLTSPPETALWREYRADRWQPLSLRARPAVGAGLEGRAGIGLTFDIEPEEAPVALCLLPPDLFARLTLADPPPPVRREDGYKGYRLP